MKDNTSIDDAYFLLAKGVHLDEIKRFVDARSPAVDPKAETIPAPASVDPTTISTVPSPPIPASMPPVPLTLPKRTALLDFSEAGDDWWDKVERWTA